MKKYFKILFVTLFCVIAFTSCQTSEKESIKIAPTEKVESVPVQDTIYESVQTYEHTAQNENHTNRNVGFGLMFFAMAAGTSVSIRVGGWKAFWTNLIFKSAETIAKQFLEGFTYNYMILFTVAKKLILVLVDKDPNNGAQVKAIFDEHGDDLVKLLFQIFGDRLASKFAKNVNISKEEKEMALAQLEAMQLTYDNAESSDFSNVLATAILEKKSEYPNLANLANPIV